MADTQPSSPKPVWAYAYQLLPPQLADRLRTVQSLLDNEHVEAQRSDRTWTGRVVAEERVTHILVVSDSPTQNQAANSKLESVLRELQAGFSISVPLEVP